MLRRKLLTVLFLTCGLKAEADSVHRLPSKWLHARKVAYVPPILYIFPSLSPYYVSSCSDESEDGLDDNPLLPQAGDSLMQVKEEPPNSLLGESSGVGNSGMLNTHSLNGVLQPGSHPLN